MTQQKEYILQLERANSILQDRVEELESKLSWEEKTKDLRVLAAEYHKMDKEIFSVNLSKIVDSFLSLDSNSIINMWSNGYRITTEKRNADDYLTPFTLKRYSVSIVGPYRSGNISYDPDKFFAVSLSVRRSFFYPFVSDKCFMVMEHNHNCPFSGAIAESAHIVDRSKNKDILNLIERVNICKKIMNGRLGSMECYVKLDSFKYPWVDMQDVYP